MAEMVIVYTSITKGYLPKARTLARSVKLHNPDWAFHVILSDSVPDVFNLDQEPFDAVWTIDQLNILNWKAWSFGYDIVELCTAVKGPAAQLIADLEIADHIIYLDPDIKVYSDLSLITDLLKANDIVLTPHLLHREYDSEAILENEISALKHGIYNLGFFAANPTGQGREFIDWWADRLLVHCFDDISGGLFTDQRWVDLAPGFFDRLHILRDVGCNVATWNIHHRPLSFDADGSYLARGVPLRFYHFTGYDSGDGKGVLLKYANDQVAAVRLWDDYGKDLKISGSDDVSLRHFQYGTFSNGVSIPRELRRLYRSRIDLQEAFPDPYAVSDWSLLTWWTAEQSRA